MRLIIYDRIKNIEIDYFNSINLNISFDSIASSFDVSFYFDPNNEIHKKVAGVSQYNLIKIYNENDLIFTGFVINHKFTSQGEKTLINISGYSVSGVLEDCQFPTEYYPLETENLTLKQIAERFVYPFRINVIVDSTVSAKMNKKIGKTKAEPSQSVKDYLVSLATQRDVIMTHNSKGELLFTKAYTNTVPILNFEENTVGTNFELSFNGQGLHSHITVIKQADKDNTNATEAQILNPFVPRGNNTRVYRPLVAIIDSGSQETAKKAAKNIRANEIKNIKLTITTDTWYYGIDNKLIKPNKTITILNKDLYIYKKSIWFIESVSYSGNPESQTTVLNCVLPCCYDGSEPQNIFV